MGLFSAECTGCHNPILPTFNTGGINDWMHDCVAIFSDGRLVRGAYDGYGCLFDDDENCVAGERAYTEPDAEGRMKMIVVSEPVCTWTEHNDGATVWHHACWQASGSPTDYRGQSPSAPDQGHFFEQGVYDIPEPKTEADVRAVTEATRAWREEIGADQ